MKTLIHSIAGKMDTYWISDVKAMLDVWTTYAVSLQEFSDSVLVKGIKHAKANKAIAWIVDSSSAKGAFSPEIQNFIGTDIFPAFTKNGIKYFITILPKDSALTRMTVKNYSSKAGPNGLELVEANSVDGAIEFLKDKK
jgi:hypothetical protein